MPRFKSGGRLTTSPTLPSLFSQKRSASTETKYFGLKRDDALFDLSAKDEALQEVLTDIQDSAEAKTLGPFTPGDLQILDGAVRFNQKREDFEILLGSSISSELEDENDETVSLVALVNPRQRISDRIKQFEGLAGRGTVHQGQGTVMFKYYVPLNEPLASESDKYSHTNPPPFFTEPIGSDAENAPDFIPTTPEQIASTHRIGLVSNGQFIPSQDPEWWWNGEYNHGFKSVVEYGDESQSALTNPKIPIVRDGNIAFNNIKPDGITSQYNWGLRFDTWFKKDFLSTETFFKFAAQVHGHLKIEYFDRTGYSSEGAVEGTWKTALDTFDPDTYYTSVLKEVPITTPLGSQLYYLQGGPTSPLGAGSGTLPVQRSAADGGAFDLSGTYLDLEETARSKFDDTYVPVVIRFWYGQPSTNPEEENVITGAPFEPAGFFLEVVSSTVTSGALDEWNDYSSQLRLEYVLAQDAWKVDTGTGGSSVGEANFANYMEAFEVVAFSELNSAKPSALDDYNSLGDLTLAIKQTAVLGVTHVALSIPGILPTNGQKIWVVGRNRPRVTFPVGSGATFSSLWQQYLFFPGFGGKYATADDLLEGVGANYVEPDPSKLTLEANPYYYRSKFGELPALNTYGPSRYDGAVRNKVTTAANQQDSDYTHEKALFIGRQLKSTTIKPLTLDEPTRNPGQNYTFIEVVENKVGFGGNVIINAFPTNDLSVLSTSVDNAQVGKFLHMADNTKTFSSLSRQGITLATPSPFPSPVDVSSGARLLYEEDGGRGRIYYGSWSGSAFTYDATGVIANLTMGSSARSHSAKQGFIADFTKPPGGGTFSFFGLIGLSRDSQEEVSVEVLAGGTTITNAGLFANNGDTINNNRYIGTEIAFSGDATPRNVTSYNAVTQTVTFSPSKTAGTYANTDIWYNHFSLGGLLPGDIVNNATNSRVTRTNQIPAPTGGNVANRLIQASLCYNSAYQYSRVDNGLGLSFGETLYIKEGDSATASSPFTPDTELPSPPASIVAPFGYDNLPSQSDPGLGGLCYPPYSTQDVKLQATAVDDSDLYDATTGQFDVWWGGRNVSDTNLGAKSLTIVDRFLLDFDNNQRGALLTTLEANAKPTFTGSEYNFKLAIELDVELPTPTGANPNLYRDAALRSNNTPVKDQYFMFLSRVGTGLDVLTANNPNWT